jgi:hypothetical protein
LLNGGTLSLKLRVEDVVVGPGVASASETALSVLFFLPFLLLFFRVEEEARGASFPVVAIPMVTSLPALIPGAVR